MKRIALLIVLLASTSFAQAWVDFSSFTASSNLYNAMNAKVALSTGAGTSSANCVAGKEVYLDTTGHNEYMCNQTNTFVQLLLSSNLGTGVLTFLGAPSSATLASAITDETGSGAAVFANTPMLVTPIIGAATGTSLIASGIVSGESPIGINTGSDPCPTGSHCSFGTTYKNGIVYNQQTAATRVYEDLPTAAAGIIWCIKNSVVSGTGAAVTGIITVKAQSGDYINNDGTIGSTGGVLSSGGAAGDAACFVASAVNHWEAHIGKGTWAP